MRMCVLWCIALLMAGSLPSSLRGQDSGQAAAVRLINADAPVRLDASGLGRVQGRFIGSNSTSLTLSTGGGDSVQVPLADLERLWTRGRATRKGALIGSVGGALLGIVGGLLISEVACNPTDGGDCTAAEVAAATGLLGGVGGAVLGAWVGFAIPVWSLRFP